MGIGISYLAGIRKSCMPKTGWCSVTDVYSVVDGYRVIDGYRVTDRYSVTGGQQLAHRRFVN